MKTWYRAVCDEHKEMADVMVSNPSCTAHYLSDYNVDIQGWLTEHGGCELRLVHRDDQLDKLWADYLDVSRAFVKNPTP